MNTIRHQVAVQSPCSSMPVHATVTIPAPPWGALDRDDRSATRPRQPAIRGARTWQQDGILRHADKRRDRG